MRTLSTSNSVVFLNEGINSFFVDPVYSFCRTNSEEPSVPSSTDDANRGTASLNVCRDSHTFSGSLK